MTAVVLFRPQKSVVRWALALGIPVFLERACFSCGQLIVTRMVAGLGNIALAADMLRIVAISESLYGLSIVLGDVLRGAGDSRTPFLIVLVGVWAVRLPLGPILLVRCGLGLAAIWIAMVADLMLRGVLCQFFVCKINWPRRAALVSGKPTTKS